STSATDSSNSSRRARSSARGTGSRRRGSRFASRECPPSAELFAVPSPESRVPDMPSWLSFDLYRTLSLRYLGRRRSRTFLIILSIAPGVATLVATQSLNAILVKAAEEAAAPLASAGDIIVINGQTGMSVKVAEEMREAKIPGVRSVQAIVMGRVTIPE